MDGNGRIVCGAIRAKKRLRFEYDGKARVVEPYCHGFTRAGAESMRAVQVRGESSSKGNAFGFGKLWTLAKVQRLEVLDEPFTPDDPGYNPNDGAFATIHCRVVTLRLVVTRS